MSEASNNLRRQMLGSAGLLALFAVIGGVLVAGTEALTRERIVDTCPDYIRLITIL